MCHVKLRPENEVDEPALNELIKTAYTNMKRRLKPQSCLRVHDEYSITPDDTIYHFDDGPE